MFFFCVAALRDSQSQASNSNLLRDKFVASVVTRATKLNLQKIELESSLRNMLPQLTTLYFAARQVGHKRGNTRNGVFHLVMQQCRETS